MNKIILTEKVPADLGTYLQVIKTNGMLFVSVQILFILETMTLISKDIKEQTR